MAPEGRGSPGKRAAIPGEGGVHQDGRIPPLPFALLDRHLKPERLLYQPGARLNPQ